MSTRSHGLDARLHAYVVEQTVNETDLMRRLRAETARLPQGEMQIAPEQGQFLRWLVELIQARAGIEIGVFTGYSALCVAQGLPPGGRLICCDLSDEWTSIARRYWREAGVADRIDLRLAPALDTLDHLLADPANHGAFDYAFIDADKRNVDAYYERVLRLLRPGGVLTLDNAFKGGRVADATADDADTLALRALNAKAARDPRVSASLVPIGDGLLLARKRTAGGA
ncbi:MAG: class I SAM-dependent methyltransferase [Phycisphaerae bacterium]|nr:class I SAM-dependent methyltransferase [Phycisphaerae bacterium]MCZ2398961.1 class I SAM-dependent methyltransferase [Phycisphaerae bacterium]NUQ49342.1 class I SAM-dependent methyltransferase [Phycisphaerae bacterium]